MKRLQNALPVPVILLMTMLPSMAMADRYVLDPGHTYANFEVSHLGFSIMHGRFNRTEGALTMDRERGKASVQATIYTDSIDTGHDKRDEHLRGEDFFRASEYPTITFRSNRVRFTGNDSAVVEGRLTMLGVTKPVTLNVDSIACDIHPMNRQYTCGFNATAALNRSDFGMKAYLPAIGDDISIRIEAEAQKQVAEQRQGGPRGR